MNDKIKIISKLGPQDSKAFFVKLFNSKITHKKFGKNNTKNLITHKNIYNNPVNLRKITNVARREACIPNNFDLVMIKIDHNIASSIYEDYLNSSIMALNSKILFLRNSNALYEMKLEIPISEDYSVTPAQKNILIPTINKVASSFLFKNTNPSPKKIFNILITGNFGKTSVSYILKYFFDFSKFKYISINTHSSTFLKYNFDINGNLHENEHLSFKKRFINNSFKKKYLIAQKNPNEFHLFKILKCTSNNQAQICSLELDLNSIYRRHLFFFQPNITILTTFLSYSFDKTLEKKLVLLKQLYLKEFSKNDINTSFVLSKDDDITKSMAITLNMRNFVFFSLVDSESDIHANKIIYSIWGTQLNIKSNENEFFLETKLIGKHNMHNLLQCYTFSFFSKIPLPYIQFCIEEIDNIPNRLEKIDVGQNFNLLIDYADTPEGIVNLIGSIYESCFIKTLTIISGKSSYSTHENKLFLKHLLDSSKKLFLTANNPKWFNNKLILNEVLMGLPDFIKYSHSGSVYDWFFDVQRIPLWFEYWFYKYQDDLGCYVIDDRDVALKICLSMAGKEDVVLVTGRGDLEFFFIFF
mmetsp:Transcript_3384/g.4524  ORF Transcript_3384/g.4524 Transcript_3384/m.4524 type:complete len:584 (+) Transcript_3384:478-2229(+)